MTHKQKADTDIYSFRFTFQAPWHSVGAQILISHHVRAKGDELAIEQAFSRREYHANRIEPSGAFVEDIIAATIDRLTFYQDSKFHCTENAHAIDFLSEALAVLENRTKDREKRKVEGTHQI